jgi:hypothetical protein
VAKNKLGLTGYGANCESTAEPFREFLLVSRAPAPKAGTRRYTAPLVAAKQKVTLIMRKGPKGLFPTREPNGNLSRAGRSRRSDSHLLTDAMTAEVGTLRLGEVS